MRRRAVVRVMEALGAGGESPGARFVGGCVRDSLLGRAITDVDVATVHPPAEATRRLEGAGVEVLPTGVEHGTVTAAPGGGGGGIEVTTLRRDVATFGRRAEVAFSDDWMGDASRRDFTFNALYADPDGTLYDPFGGRADLAARRVRFIGLAARRIHEDYLRALRYFRFLAWHGRRPDRGTLNAASKAIPGLAHVSPERKRAEVLKLLAAPRPEAAVAAMAATGVLGAVVGGWSDPSARTPRRALAGLGRLARAEEGLGLADPLRRLALLVPEGAADERGRLRLSRAERARLRAARGGGPPPRTEREARLAVWRDGREAALDRILIGAALAGRPALARVRALADEARGWRPPAFPLRGGDVARLGIPPGPRTGALLGAVEGWWAEGGFRAGRRSCLGELRRRAGEARPPTRRRAGGAT